VTAHYYIHHSTETNKYTTNHNPWICNYLLYFKLHAGPSGRAV